MKKGSWSCFPFFPGLFFSPSCLRYWLKTIGKKYSVQNHLRYSNNCSFVFVLHEDNILTETFRKKTVLKLLSFLSCFCFFSPSCLRYWLKTIGKKYSVKNHLRYSHVDSILNETFREKRVFSCFHFFPVFVFFHLHVYATDWKQSVRNLVLKSSVKNTDISKTAVLFTSSMETLSWLKHSDEKKMVLNLRILCFCFVSSTFYFIYVKKKICPTSCKQCLKV